MRYCLSILLKDLLAPPYPILSSKLQYYLSFCMIKKLHEVSKRCFVVFEGQSINGDKFCLFLFLNIYQTTSVHYLKVIILFTF